MEELFLKISVTKVLEMALIEEREKIRKYYMEVLGKPTADFMDAYVPTESSILKMFEV